MNIITFNEILLMKKIKIHRPNSKKIGLTLMLTLLSTIGFASSDKYHLETAPIKLDNSKPDFRSMKDVAEKKKVFIDFMSKEIDEANKEICKERKTVLDLQKLVDSGKELNTQQKTTINKYSQFYKIWNVSSSKDQLNDLLSKVNIAPKSLVIAQAILETGWGTSRFAVDYNNYFGLHCFEDNCGVKAKDSDVQVETFKDVGDSVLGYYNRLNTGGKFVKFREIRKVNGTTQSNTARLINTLSEYSSLKDNEYATRLESVIKYNNLDRFNSTC